MKEFARKFLSRKFLASLSAFIVSALLAFYGEQEWIRLVATLGVIVSPLVYVFIEGWLDGKAIFTFEHIPTVSRAIRDLVEVYEDKKGENDISKFIEDLAILVENHFASGEPDDEDLIDE
jgi:hypothetical protein